MLKLIPILALLLMGASPQRFGELIVTGPMKVGATTVADSSSIMDLQSTTKGILVPRMTTTQRDAIVSPATGLLIFNTTTSRFNLYAGSWVDTSVILNRGDDLTNLGIDSSVASNNLTVSLKQKDGSSDPTSGLPVSISFRSSTANSGSFTFHQVMSALSITANSGATFGTVSGVNQFIYVYIQYNSGTPELCLSGSHEFDEGQLQTTTTISAGATSRSVLYCSVGRASQPIRFIGRIRVNEAVAGTYATAPNEEVVTPSNQDALPRSTIRLDSGNGTGSTATKIRRFLNVGENIGTALTLTQSATNGDTILVNENGIYSISYCDRFAGAGGAFGVSTTGTTTSNVETLATTAVLTISFASSSDVVCASPGAVFLYAGTTLRPHIGGAAGVDTTGTYNRFVVTKVSN